MPPAAGDPGAACHTGLPGILLPGDITGGAGADGKSPMFEAAMVDLPQLQLTLTSLVYFLFVPLTPGLAWILVIMESVHVMTGKQVYRDMARFWARLLGISFAVGIAARLVTELDLAINWARYAHYAGAIFGEPLAAGRFLALLAESVFVAIFFLGWNRLGPRQHLLATFTAALGTNLCVLWPVVANAWMQNPVGAQFDPETMRMELTSLEAVLLNPVAQVKFVHTLAAGYVTAAMFVAGISGYHLLKRRHTEFARRSFAAAMGFGMASVVSVIVLGDEAGYVTGDVQKARLAAIAAEWETREAPAAFTVIGVPDDEAMETRNAMLVPAMLGVIATRSLDEQVTGIRDLIGQHEQRIRAGIVAYGALQDIRDGIASDEDRALFDLYREDLGYGLLLKRYTDDVADATDVQIRRAARSTIPPVATLFWSFRIMVAGGLWMLLLFAIGFYLVTRGRIQRRRWLLRAFLWSMPVPWIAGGLGWVVSGLGRQPWTIGEVLPTSLATSAVAGTDAVIGFAGFGTVYTLLVALWIYRTSRLARRGPEPLRA